MINFFLHREVYVGMSKNAMASCSEWNKQNVSSRYSSQIAARYEGRLNISHLRKLEKVSIKARKAELDLNFLRNCQSFGVFPKFTCFHLPATTNRQDALAFTTITKRHTKTIKGISQAGPPRGQPIGTQLYHLKHT